ncbi:MAG: response regulator transcription factor [bacterium]
MNRILIADDHAIFRKGLRMLLDKQISGLTLGEASNAVDTLRELEHFKWDLLILDIDLQGRSGLDLLEDIHRRLPNLSVLMLTGYPEVQFAVLAMQHGAKGYLCKDCEPTELISAVRILLAGQRYITPAVADVLAAFIEAHAAEQALARRNALEGRMLEVVRLIGQGMSVKEISAELDLSIKTVSTYKKRAMQQLDIHSTAGLVRHCLQHGLTT